MAKTAETSENDKIFLSVSRGLKRFESEIAFLIGIFFFVFLGMISTVSSLMVLASGIALSIIILLVRYVAVWLTARNNSLQRERGMLTVILTRGLATAVLATCSVWPLVLGYICRYNRGCNCSYRCNGDSWLNVDIT